jgi:outer membrane protein assembly factor BamB
MMIGRMKQPRAKVRVSRERDVVSSAPIVSGQRCYLEVAARSAEIVCLDIDKGREVWRRPSENFFPIACQDHHLVLSTGVEMKVVTEENLDEAWRLDAELNTWTPWRDMVIVAGNPLQCHDVASGAVVRTIELPAVPWGAEVSGDYYLGFSEDGRACVGGDLLKPSARWSADLRPALESVPEDGRHEGVARGPGVGDVFVLSFRSQLFGFSVRSGEFLWRQPIRTAFPPGITRDRIHTWSQADHRSPAHLVCLEPRSGHVIFDRDLSPIAPSFSQHMDAFTPLVHRDAVILTTGQGMVCACSPETGEPLWHYQHKRPVQGAALAGDELLVATGDGFLLIFSLTHA